MHTLPHPGCCLCKEGGEVEGVEYTVVALIIRTVKNNSFYDCLALNINYPRVSVRMY